MHTKSLKSACFFAQNGCLTIITLIRGPNIIIRSHVKCTIPLSAAVLLKNNVCVSKALLFFLSTIKQDLNFHNYLSLLYIRVEILQSLKNNSSCFLNTFNTCSSTEGEPIPHFLHTEDTPITLMFLLFPLKYQLFSTKDPPGRVCH